MPTTTDPWTETGTSQTTAADGHPAGYPAGAALPMPQSHDSRGLGRRGVIAVTAAAAVLASLVTTVSLNAFGSPTSTSTSPIAQQSAPLVTGGATAPNWIAIAAGVKPSVVSVRVQGADGSGGQGSGVVLDTTGRVLTNNHVVAGAGAGGTISVLLSDGRAYAATVVGVDPATDLAVIAMKQAPGGLVPATFADSSKVKVGDAVMAIGNPLGLSSTVTTGVVSALNRPVTTSQEQQQGSSGQAQPQSEQVVTNAIQTDAAVNPGNSGGALLDSAGRVIGITSSIASLGAPQGGQAGSIGLGFAIPANEAKDVANQLITTGSVQHAYLGVTLADGTVTLGGAQREAAVVGTVASGTPAAKAGLQAKDSIIGINGQPLQGADSLVAQVRAQHPGTTIDLTVVRGGRQQTVHVTLAVRPATTG